MSHKFITGLFFTFLTVHLLANEGMEQTIRGTIKDQDTEMPLIGATIMVLNSDPILGSITDLEGNFRIERVPVGRVTLKVTYVGYEEKLIPNLLVDAAKEVVLDIPIIESVSSLETIVVTAEKNKGEVLNEMAMVSARTFSVDETKRYAGSFGDPARMVASFAGVTSNAEGNNDIVVRGNSPRGILWRLEGIEIPNPNHFANEGSTGGPINALNNNMLSDSDFFTGAFSPEYGNALSGVFDMKLKKGNNQRREYTAGFSTLGLDFTAEGPFKKGYDGSYLANYRYSSLALIDNLGITDFGGVPKYQDLSFNVYLPVNRNHFISVFGLGGISSIDAEWEDSGIPLERGQFGTDMGTVGLSHTFLMNNQSYLKTTFSGTATVMKGFYEFPEEGADDYYLVEEEQFQKTNLRIASTYNHKFNAKHKMETGFIYSRLGFDMFTNSRNFDLDRMELIMEDEGTSDAIQAFTSWKYRVNEAVTMVSGLHFLHFALNGSSSIEPRAALNWQTSPRGTFSLGVGVHSRLESVSTYLATYYDEDGTASIPNRNLSPTRAAHYVLGYEYVINPNTRLKAEVYYQDLFDVPIEDSDTSTFSLLNSTDGYVSKALVNRGTGRNYGIEFTLEQFLHKGFYYMFTGSLYESFYTSGDGIERKTAFNGNYATNFLLGKEFRMGKPEKNKVFFVNTKMTLLGGQRSTPINYDASVEAGYEVRYEDRPFSQKSDDIFIANLAVGTRRNKGNTTREFKLDIQNVANGQAVVNEYYHPVNQKIYKGKQLGMFPTISYSISF